MMSAYIFSQSMSCYFCFIHAFVAENGLSQFSSGKPAMDAVKLCSGNTVDPVTVKHPVKFSFCIIVLFVKVYFILFYYLLLICQTKIFLWLF